MRAKQAKPRQRGCKVQIDGTFSNLQSLSEFLIMPITQKHLKSTQASITSVYVCIWLVEHNFISLSLDPGGVNISQVQEVIISIQSKAT